MGKKDSIVRKFLEKQDVFADLFNGMIFGGECVIKPDTLENISKETTVLVKSKHKEITEHLEVIEKERDVFKRAYIEGQEVYLLVCGAEHQSHIDESMPFRVLLYDTLEYLSQVTDIRQKHKRKKDVTGAEYVSLYTKEDKLVPTISIVFYTGKDIWDGNSSMKDMYMSNPLSELLNKFTVQYKMNLLSVYNVEEVEKFHSDLRLLFDLLKHTEDSEDLTDFLMTHKEYHKVNELTYLTLSLFLDITKEEIELEKYRVGGDVYMCKAVMELKENGRRLGLEEGLEQGLEQGICILIQDSLEEGIAEERICMKLEKYYGLSLEAASERIYQVKNGCEMN